MYSGPLLTSELEFFATGVNSIDKSFILDVPGVAGYNDRLSSASSHSTDTLPWFQETLIIVPDEKEDSGCW